MSSTEAPKEADKATGVETAEHVKPTETTSTAAAPDPEVDDVPDPDEDDLDDLDDMLDEFSSVKLDAQKPAEAPKAATAQPAPESKDSAPKADAPFGTDGDFSEEEFAKQLQAGMADLLGEFEKSPDMQSQFEEMFKHMSAAAGETSTGAAAGEGAPKAAAGEPAAGGADASFQETIRRTMERMQNSGDQATAAAAEGGEDDFMAEMLKQLSSGDFKGEGGEEEFSKMLMGMMDQLTNKEILYEPMKELDQKFPDWLEKNRATTSAEDLKRYEEQKVLVAEIVAKFEEASYSDSSTPHREYIVDRMQKMQAAGSPPSDLVGDMASAQEAFNGPGDDQCNPQ